MTWKQNLRPASFRGVSFHVDDRQYQTGRRIHVHEFPKRDTPSPEDMGKKSIHITLTAYLVGDDYMSRRDALISACERKGAGQLVDFWGRSRTVVCEDCSVTETQAEGRYCKVALKFVEAGGARMPMAIAATAAQLAMSAGGLQLAGVTAFAAKALVGQSSGSIATALGLVRSGLPSAILNRAAGAPLRSYNQ